MKARGAILIVIGLFLVLFMGAVAIALVPNLLDAGKPSAGGRIFTGTFAQG